MIENAKARNIIKGQIQNRSLKGAGGTVTTFVYDM